MKFYVVTMFDGEIAGCELTLRDAKKYADQLSGEFTVDAIEVAVDAESIRRLLGHEGGYLLSQRRVYPREVRS